MNPVLILGACILVPVILLFVASEIHRRHDESVARKRAAEVEKRLAAAKETGTFTPKWGDRDRG